MIKAVYQKGFFHLLSANFLTQFLGFGTMLLVTKFLTPVEIGEIKIIQSYVSLFIILGSFGYTTSILKLCSDLRSQEEKNYIFLLALKRGAVATIFALGLLVVLSFSGLISKSEHINYWMLIYAAVIPLAVSTQMLMTFLQALKQIKEMAKAQSIIKLQSFVFIVGCTWFWKFPGFIYATIFAHLIALWPLFRQVGRVFSFQSLKKIKPKSFQALATFSVLGSFISQMGRMGDIFLLDQLSNQRELIGYYSLATIFVLAAEQVTSTVQSIATPYFSEKSKDRSWIVGKLIHHQSRLSLLSVAVAVVVYGAVTLLLHYFYSENYSITLTFLSLLLVRYVIWSSYSVMGSVVVGLGKIKHSFVVLLLLTPINLFIVYLCIEKWGVVGAAYGQIISSTHIFIASILINYMILRKKNFTMTNESLHREE